MIRTYRIQTGLFSPSTVTLHLDRALPGLLVLASSGPSRQRQHSFSQSSARLNSVDSAYLTEGRSRAQSHSHDAPRGLASNSSSSYAGDSPTSSQASKDSSDSQLSTTLEAAPELASWRKSSVALPQGRRVILHSLATGQVLWETDVVVPDPTSFVGQGHGIKLELRQPKVPGARSITLRLRVEFCLATASFQLNGHKLRWTLLSNALGVGDGAFICMDTVARQPVARLEYSPLKLFRQSGRFSIQDQGQSGADSLIVFTLLVALEFCRQCGLAL
ncbi:hypothetical protein H4R33_000270 [Dimargaris cristalligena]|uniref:Uncharacterized protein n=1 Tax=Dimargaris cristalligena TaxID=215637 RepID=A0A4V1J5A6_9FUNG|nr:hypothetical protein H4R33_000270 [Dimargaris cristalligena]RKP38389.1 hypothetical protein BJ085DRAFT_30612 [Dimargaris cristalligena]|eukprot:RKP38389.1 hypothetical protein BJ085DRAFT_30612 [Dimargaris cristalligena]